MIQSKKLIIMMCVGTSLVIGYIVYEDTYILEYKIHQFFMLGVLVFFTIMNFIRYAKTKGEERYESR